MESFSDINVGVDPSEVSEHNDAVIWGEDHTTKHWGDVEEVIGEECGEIYLFPRFVKKKNYFKQSTFLIKGYISLLTFYDPLMIKS